MNNESEKSDRRERFLRLAPKRTQRVLNDLSRLARCANHVSYDYTPDEAHQILRSIQNAASKLSLAFFPPASGPEEFSLTPGSQPPTN